jgi:hypothetical protein
MNFVLPDRLKPLIQHVAESVSVHILKTNDLFTANDIIVESLAEVDSEGVFDLTYLVGNLIPNSDIKPAASKLTVMNSKMCDGTYFKYLDELSITGDRRSGLISRIITFFPI